MTAITQKLFEILAVIYVIAYFQQCGSDKPYRFLACEDDNKRVALSCCHGKINILVADYGRWTTTNCVHPSLESYNQNTTCRTPKAQKIVEKACNGKPKCMLQASNYYLNDDKDPCRKTYKYLNITYDCCDGKD